MTEKILKDTSDFSNLLILKINAWKNLLFATFAEKELLVENEKKLEETKALFEFENDWNVDETKMKQASLIKRNKYF